MSRRSSVVCRGGTRAWGGRLLVEHEPERELISRVDLWCGLGFRRAVGVLSCLLFSLSLSAPNYVCLLFFG